MSHPHGKLLLPRERKVLFSKGNPISCFVFFMLNLKVRSNPDMASQAHPHKHSVLNIYYSVYTLETGSYIVLYIHIYSSLPPLCDHDQITTTLQSRPDKAELPIRRKRRQIQLRFMRFKLQDFPFNPLPTFQIIFTCFDDILYYFWQL